MVMHEKTVLIIGTLDTKGEECLYIRDLVWKRGLRGLIIDPGPLGKPLVQGDISRRDVAGKAGCHLEDLVRTGDKGYIIRKMTEGLKTWVADLYQAGRIQGVIAIGGGQGTAMGTEAMQALPLGFPKVMVSTLASGNMRPFIQTKDIAVFPAVTDVFGLNFIFRRILDNAVEALVAMARKCRPLEKTRGKVVGATAFGVTTAGLMKMKTFLEERGFEMVLFHANGAGGRAMEEMGEAGYFDGIMDWTTHEIMDEVTRGLFSAGKDRLSLPARSGLPYLLAPGAIDYIVKGPFQDLSRTWQKRNHIIHNRNITLVRATAREMGRAAGFLASRVNKAIGPLKFLIPLKGFSEPNAKGKPFFDPEADGFFIDVLKKGIRNPRVEIIEMDAHINDASFVEEAARLMIGMLEARNEA